MKAIRRHSMMRRLGRIKPWWRRFKRNGYRREHCDYCGHPFRWSRDARHASGNRDGKVWHGPCLSLVTIRAKAEERLTVLGVVAELTGITGSDVRAVMAGRAANDIERSREWDRAWRVFYDLEKATKPEGGA